PVSTWVEVDLDRFNANLRAIRGHIGPGREVLLVAKADAYGHGSADMAAAAEREGVTQLGVATLLEGMQLRRSGSRLPIMAMSPLLPGEIPEAGGRHVAPPVCDMGFARALSDEAGQVGRARPAGANVSYARQSTTQRPTRVGGGPVGYAHGYSWLLSNRGHMLVGGRRVPILGRVTMDLTMVDVTEVPDVAVGDEVVLFGEQRGASLPIEEVAQGSETLAYEILCTIGKRVT